MSQLNIHMTLKFEKDLQKFMKLRHIKTKAEAVRIAIQESLEHALPHKKKIDFSAWLGLATQVPVSKKTSFSSDDDLWK
ncbi:MAG TPA: hypothetical protein VLH77_00865 [Gammaproteobacteria bacterium]|nr:hypothetical protein [Gammaproteobacteria bacterium]